MTNHGSIPGNIPERVDLRLACGWTVRDRDPRKYRWSLKGEAGDITDWQPTNGKVQ